jgi:hypothetical protein
MAPEPHLDDFGALAIKAPRVNIFARPAPTNGARASRLAAPSGAFDASAACRSEPIADALEDRLPASRAWTRTIGIAAVAAVCAAAVVVATAPRHHQAAAPAPAAEPAIGRPTSPPLTHRDSPPHRRALPRRKRTSAYAERTRRVQHSRPHARSSRATPAAPSTPPAPAPIAPPVTPRTPPTSAPTRPIPARVPKGAPPEFM